MRARLRSLDQLMPLPTAGELLDPKRRSLISVYPSTTARNALREMENNDIAFLPVLEGKRLVGVVSERDIARGVLLQHRAMVRDIMTTDVKTVAPETGISECMTLMHANRIRHLPVVSGEGVLGVLSVRDLMGSLIERHERLLRRLHDESVTLLFPSPSSY
jgi:CBS domain-containing protein